MTTRLRVLQKRISVYMWVKYFVSVSVAVWSDAEICSRMMTEIEGSNPFEVAEFRHIVFLACNVGIFLGKWVITLTVLAVIPLTTQKSVLLHTMELLFISFATHRTFWILTTLIDRYEISSYSPLSPGPTPLHL